MSKHKYIKTPDELYGLFLRYKDWCKATPVLKEDYVGKDANRVLRQLERPLTWVGFECWLQDEEIISSLSHYEENTGEAYTEYLPIISRIKKYIEADQFTGAVVGVYQQNIISRKLGLTEKTDNKIEVIKPIIIDWGDECGDADTKTEGSGKGS